MASTNQDSTQDTQDETKDWHETTLKIPFKSAQHADIARRVILVDRELNGHLVERTLVVQDNILIASTYRTATVRLLRLATNGFIENLQLVIRTIHQFAPPSAVEQSREGVMEDVVAAGTTV